MIRANKDQPGISFGIWFRENTGIARTNKQRSLALNPARRTLMDLFRNEGEVNIMRDKVFIMVPAIHIATMIIVNSKERVERSSEIQSSE